MLVSLRCLKFATWNTSAGRSLLFFRMSARRSSIDFLFVVSRSPQVTEPPLKHGSSGGLAMAITDRRSVRLCRFRKTTAWVHLENRNSEVSGRQLRLSRAQCSAPRRHRATRLNSVERNEADAPNMMARRLRQGGPGRGNCPVSDTVFQATGRRHRTPKLSLSSRVNESARGSRTFADLFMFGENSTARCLRETHASNPGREACSDPLLAGDFLRYLLRPALGPMACYSSPASLLQMRRTWV